MRCSATNRDEVASHRLPKVITASLEMKKHEGGRPYDTILPPTGIYPKNIERDRRQCATLAEAGWRIGTVWECALKGKTRLPFDGVVDQCAIWLKSDIKTLEVRGDAARATV